MVDYRRVTDDSFPSRALRSALRLLLVLATASALAGCQDLLPTAKEAAISPAAAPQTVAVVQKHDAFARQANAEMPEILAAYGGAYHDPRMDRLLAGIVGSLTAVPENRGESYRITILNSPTINAFALPGGYIFISRGMLALANDSSEVAGIISHEMGHVIANHGIKRERFDEEQALAVRVADEVLSSPLAKAEAAGESKLRIAAFSRQQEFQADAIGVKLLGEAGYDPYASARFLKAMETYRKYQADGRRTSNQPDFLDDHPSSPERIAAIDRLASAFGPPGTGKRDRQRYLDGIDGLLYGDSPGEGYVRGQSFLHPGLGIRFDVPQGFTINNTKKAVLADGPNHIAIRFDAAETNPHMSAIDYLVSGWVKGLVAGSARIFSINGLQAASARAHAGKWDYVITVIRDGKTTYRLLFAAPTGSASLATVAKATDASFRHLSDKERAALKPLHVRIVTVRPGDTIASLSRRMQGTDRPEALFRALNQLPGNARLNPGEKVKIVTA